MEHLEKKVTDLQKQVTALTEAGDAKRAAAAFELDGKNEYIRQFNHKHTFHISANILLYLLK